jgi:phenylacetyl-CoA:acceptor oxidoreductase subunit 2
MSAPGRPKREYRSAQHEGAPANYGPSPAQQTSWDARAAANFVCGGTGAGLIVFAALARVDGQALALLVLAGLALVAAGLLCVWHEIGRPLRALHVFFHPRTSWMSREAFVATLLFPAGLAAAARVPGSAWVAGLLALAFAVCQGRMLQSARGIPAWRQRLVASLLVVTALVEGAGLLLVASPWILPTQALLASFAGLVLLRVVVWLAYRGALGPTLAPRAAAALDAAGLALQFAGTFVPLLLVLVVAAVGSDGAAASATLALAGVAAAASGWYVKYVLVVRAGYTQGFALAHLPVRGTPSDRPPTPAASAAALPPAGADARLGAAYRRE